MEEQENEQKVLQFIRAFYSTENVIKRLEYCHAIATATDSDTMKRVSKQMKGVKNIRKDIEDILKNSQLMRQFHLRYSMTDSSEAVLYFGKDFGEDDAYRWLPEVEKQISQTNIFLLKFVNIVLKEVKFGDKISLNY
jgi:hypothetical protein